MFDTSLNCCVVDVETGLCNSPRGIVNSISGQSPHKFDACRSTTSSHLDYRMETGTGMSITRDRTSRAFF
jgi:hypothetical protein